MNFISILKFDFSHKLADISYLLRLCLGVWKGGWEIYWRNISHFLKEHTF